MSPLISTYFLQRQPDDRLVAAARAGNERAFEVLVRRHHHQLLAYARRLTGTDALAEDALQQALLQAWVGLRGNAHPEQFRPWAFRIVHNVAVSGLRRSQHAVVGLDEALETAERVDSLDGRIAFREALIGLAALPEPQRRAIVLTAFGSSHDEAAAELGLSGGAVRGLIYRARATLRSAAGLLPAPLVSWVLRRPRRSTVGEHAAELLAGSSSVGAGGLIAKAGVIAATAGALAAGTQIIPGPTASHHQAARRTVRIAERHAAASGTSRPGARTPPTVLLSSTSTGDRGTTEAASHSPAAGRARPQASDVRSPTGESPRSSQHGSDGGGSGGGSRESSGGGVPSGSGGGDSSHGGSGDGSSPGGTTQGGHDLSGSDGGGGGSATAAASTGSTDGSSATPGSGSVGATSDGQDGGGGGGGGSSTPTASSDGGGDTTTTPNGS